MKKKLSIVTLLTIVMTMCFGMTVFASPKTMPDGTVFDAEYYAKTYPDVTAVFGTDENALYQHYVTMGKAEGRHPVASADTKKATATASNTGTIKETPLSSTDILTLQADVISFMASRSESVAQEGNFVEYGSGLDGAVAKKWNSGTLPDYDTVSNFRTLFTKIFEYQVCEMNFSNPAITTKGDGIYVNDSDTYKTYYWSYPSLTNPKDSILFIMDMAKMDYEGFCNNSPYSFKKGDIVITVTTIKNVL